MEAAQSQTKAEKAVAAKNEAETAVVRDKLSAKQFPELQIGAITEVFGVPCMLASVNTGKRRLTMVPLNAGTGVPNPVSQRSRSALPPKKGRTDR